MIECILTISMYIGLMVEYLVLYPDTVQWFENIVVIMLMLGLHCMSDGSSKCVGSKSQIQV